MKKTNNNITELVFILDRSGSMGGLESDTIGGFNALLNITDKDYTVRGCTALLDALGDAIHHIGNIHKYARPEDVPAQTMFVIITDGMENASRRYDGKTIKKLIEKEQSKYGWEFLFIGANIDAVTTAKSYGIAAQNAVDYHADSQGTAVVYEAVCDAVSNMRVGASLPKAWSKSIKADNKKSRR